MPTDPQIPRPSRLPGWPLVVLAALAAFRAVALPPHSAGLPGHRTLLRHVTLCDPSSGSALPDRDVLWSGGRVLRVAAGGSLPPRGAAVVDGRGLWAFPALADAAVFLGLEGRYPGVSEPSSAGDSLRAQARSGMDSVLDLNSDRGFIREARKLDAPGVLPRALFAGALFAAPGGWRVPGQTPWAADIAEVQEPADLADPWSRAVRFGDQAIFADVDGGPGGLAIPLPVLKTLGALARSRGLPFIVGTGSAGRALAALAAHPDALLGPLTDADGDTTLARAMLTSGCAYIPAVGSVLDAFPPGPQRAWLRSLPASAALPPAVLGEITDPANRAEWAAHWTRMGVDPGRIAAGLRFLADAGVRLVFGTGSGLPLVFQGWGAEAEISQWTRCGLSPSSILVAATVASHRFLGLEGGRIAPGEPADLLLLAEDPFRDPAAAARPRAVFLDGVQAVPGPAGPPW